MKRTVLAIALGLSALGCGGGSKESGGQTNTGSNPPAQQSQVDGGGAAPAPTATPESQPSH